MDFVVCLEDSGVLTTAGNFLFGACFSQSFPKCYDALKTGVLGRWSLLPGAEKGRRDGGSFG